MAFVTQTFDNTQEMVDYLNDIVVGNSFPINVRVQGLHGLTLIVNDGAERTCTFADASGVGLLPKEIMDQIHAAHAAFATIAFRNYGHDTPGRVRLVATEAGDIVDKDGTANTVLGFPTAADSTVGANAVALADVLTVFHLENNRIGVIHQ